MREFVAASGHFPDEVIAEIPPRNGRATVEKIAINAVMAGAPADAMPLLIAAIEAMTDTAVQPVRAQHDDVLRRARDDRQRPGAPRAEAADGPRLLRR